MRNSTASLYVRFIVMMILGDNRDQEIERLKLSKNILKLIQGGFVHEDLEFRCNKLKYSLEPEEFSPEGIDLIPLWEGEYSITGFYISGSSYKFITYYIDDIEAKRIIATNETELIDYLVIQYAEHENELRNLLHQ